MRTIILTYFKRGGKFYTSAEYETKARIDWDGNNARMYMYEVFDEVKAMKENGDLPGLVKGASDYVIHVEPKTDVGYPGLIF